LLASCFSELLNRTNMTILQRIFGIWYWLCGANQENSASVDKNYTVHQLWPEDKENVEPNSNTLTLIFFHGLQLKDGKSPWRTTWKARDTDECWPQKWLPEDLREKGIQNVRVLSLSYDSIASRWFGRGRTKDVSDIGQYLVDNLICRYGDPTSTPISVLWEFRCCLHFDVVSTGLHERASAVF
jgi:hypothetical protein